MGKYWDIKPILKLNAHWNIIFGERSNGKTYGTLKHGLEDHVRSNYVNQIGYIRRWDEDLKGKTASSLFSGLEQNGEIEKITKGKYTSTYFYSGKWYLCNYDEDGKRVDTAPTPFCIGFALSMEEHYKSMSFPHITTIIEDEFITRDYYLNEEFLLLTSLLSTIIRLRDDAKIFLLGNTISKFNPYFAELGIKRAKNMKRGEIDIYTYGDSGLKVAVEYASFDTKSKKSNVYFSFDNPKLHMIRGDGDSSWEIALYPHLPRKYLEKDIYSYFFIEFDEIILQGDIIQFDDGESFIYIHRKTTPIRDDGKYLVFSQEYSYKRNYRRKINIGDNSTTRSIWRMYLMDKFFFQDNEVGDIVHHYIEWCNSNE